MLNSRGAETQRREETNEQDADFKGTRGERKMSKILLVDDEPKLTRMLELMFSTKGHRVSIANTGTMALSMVDAEAPDLMLLDIMLPGIDGLEVLKSLKASERQFPVILLSGVEDLNVINDAMKMGASSHFSKPFRPSDLYNAVMICLGGK